MEDSALKQSGEAKIFSLEELAKEVARLKEQGKKIVQCHGVFDLLHIGHIRHLQEAKRLGDILVVTLTEDRHVNKGPHRPAFPQQLRLEAMAALDCVDFLAVSCSPRATEAIKTIKPDFYVKGPDFKNKSKDYTGGILEEEEAVKAVGGEIVFTEDITFSSTNLLNRHFNMFPKEVEGFLNDFRSRFSSADIFNFLDGAGDLKVLVVGEAIIDEYQYCEAMGKSSKEPMLAVKRLSTEHFLGGTLAVANHLASFCKKVGLVTFLGDKNSHERFIRDNMASNIDLNFLKRKDSPTIVKRRMIENYFFTKLMAVYDINDGALSDRDEKALCKTLETEIPKYDVVLVFDFGHGMFTPASIGVLCSKSKYLAVNAQSNAGNVGYQSITKYPKVDYVCTTENEMRMEMRDRRGDIKSMIKAFAESNGYKRITVTRGNRGSLTYTADEGFTEVPALTVKVVDRMGAGDAYFALTVICAARNIPTEAISFIGNCVGAQAVATVGHRRFIEKVPLYKHIESLLK
ncbi:MAG: hypothetical protein A2Z83_07685 [Omnitrophica bacterium GWA2_52_8]|nr:MAG: hypothetical protein A2Z83_07685 [Omnitrophica bacterium GWA2_52_8]